jgi:hypothetical protein
MSRIEPETVFLMRRAREEEHLSLKAASREAALSHHGLAVHYSASAKRSFERADAKEQSVRQGPVHRRAE